MCSFAPYTVEYHNFTLYIRAVTSGDQSTYPAGERSCTATTLNSGNKTHFDFNSHIIDLDANGDFEFETLLTSGSSYPSHQATIYLEGYID